ncbi:MAG TPA: type II toxin-antitoxin system HipA family toxin [Solirubrobacterales bacterium]|nr:type II toxin-antitoxin system HipA family toxin [Solirubrobacterales bacterium]
MNPPPQTLSVFLRGRPVGSLERTGSSRYRFAYSEDAIEGDRSDPMARLSASLPLREERFKPSESAPFFEGLLPEGAVRATVAGKLGLSEGNGFGLLAALGADCAGAVMVLPTDQPPGSAVGPPFPLSESQVAELLRDLPRDPLGVDVDPGGVRLSLGGVQDKLILIRLPGGEFAQPLGGMPSNCLLKPEHERFEGLAVNEAFCMRVAAAAGNETAMTELLEFDGIRCLYSERFDRTVDADGATVRLHQEDMCQALGLLPTQKYEAEGGPSVASVIALLRRQPSPRIALDVNAFVRAMLTSFLLGNSDAHGKNFSLLYDPATGVRLAPLYDVVSTAVYDGLTPRLAMAIGGEDDPSQVDLLSWERLGAESGLGGALPRFVQRWSSEVLAATEACLGDAEWEGWSHPVLEAIADVCRERARRLIDGR